jgi:diguanylate cyclase (GGDEF)-like protein
MADLRNDQCDILEKYTDGFAEYVKKSLVNKLQAQIGYRMPSEVDAVLARLQALAAWLPRRQDENPAKEIFHIPDEHLPTIKRLVLWQRRVMATRLEEPLSKTFHPELIANLERDLEPLQEFMELPWFEETTPLRVPHLTEFLAIKFVEEMQDKEKSSAPERREYDEKFHILQAPTLFMKDLRLFRDKCELRSNGLVAAYLDVDNFKGFNTRYGETKIDRDLLPRFMELMESHVYMHGYAYRYGGDEYVLLLPNMSLAMGLGFIKEFQQKLRLIRYRGIEEQVTVSVGAVWVGSDCFLTEREIEDRANRGKNFAKKSGKNCVATYRGNYFTEKDLFAVK